MPFFFAAARRQLRRRARDAVVYHARSRADHPATAPIFEEPT